MIPGLFEDDRSDTILGPGAVHLAGFARPFDHGATSLRSPVEYRG